MAWGVEQVEDVLLAVRVGVEHSVKSQGGLKRKVKGGESGTYEALCARTVIPRSRSTLSVSMTCSFFWSWSCRSLLI